MKKNLLLLSAIALSINLCEAQVSDNSRKKFQFGVKIGSNYSNIYDSNGENFDAEGKLGFAGGLFVAIPIGKFLGVQPEILFSQKGYKQTGAFLGSTYELTRTTDYVDIPLLLSIKPADFLTIQLGPQFSFLTKRKDVFKNALSTIEQQNEFKNDNIRKNTLCAIGGVDINIRRVIIGVRAGWDIQDNNGDGTSTNPRYKNAWVQATLGLRIL
ncbi:MAG: porin family protein [Emticicia sp.]|uniref:porin family protein n=1 Tax=Emticicia sp. TaxID=1930953 RepID=UPI003BA743A4